MERQRPIHVAPLSHEGMGELSLSEKYREYAAECLRLAQNAANDDDRAHLVSMAEAWRELAEKIDARSDE